MTRKEHLNPDGLFKSPAFSQVVTTQGTGKTIYIGGQNAVNKEQETIGKGSLSQQTEQVMKNLKLALASSRADFEDLVKLNIYLVQGQDAREGFEAVQKVMGNLPNQPLVKMLYVSGLADPDHLVEMDGIAFVPGD